MQLLYNNFKEYLFVFGLMGREFDFGWRNIKQAYFRIFFTKIYIYIYIYISSLISSKGFNECILSKEDYESKLIYFPNWGKDTTSKGDSNYPSSDMPQGFKFVVAGNIGISQDMESIMNAALELKNHTDIKFILIGDGRSRSFVENFIDKNDLQQTVFVLGKFPVEAMNSFFKLANGLLVSLKDELIFNLTVPAKVQAYMSS
jgi:glycosyltransferase involved in cell wall biosynthesis